jgi:hypothetical protein
MPLFSDEAVQLRRVVRGRGRGKPLTASSSSGQPVTVGQVVVRHDANE